MMVQHFLNIVVRVERQRRIELTVNEIVGSLDRRRWWGIERLFVNIRIDLHFLLVRRNVDIRCIANRVSPWRLSWLLIAARRHRPISRMITRARIDKSTARMRTIRRRIASFRVKWRWLHVAACLRGHRWNRAWHNWTTRLTRTKQSDHPNRQTTCPEHTSATVSVQVFSPTVDCESKTKTEWTWSVRSQASRTMIRTIGLGEFADGDHGGLAFPNDDQGIADNGRCCWGAAEISGWLFDPLERRTSFDHIWPY